MRRAAFAKVADLGAANDDVIFVGSDIAAEAVRDLQIRMPGRVLMEGIAEGHLIGMACGLSKEGNVVFVNTIASFLSRRCLDQVAINLCLERANVKLLAQGGGLLYGKLGPTHHANEDLALMRALPGMTVIVPCDVEQAQQAVELAYRTPGPVYIRLGTGNMPVVSAGHSLKLTAPIVYRAGRRVFFVATGTMVQVALEVSACIEGSAVIGIPVIKPFSFEAIGEILQDAELVISIEEHSAIGGLSSSICESIVKAGIRIGKFISFSLEDAFVKGYGTQAELLSDQGLSKEKILLAIQSIGRSFEKSDLQ